MCKRYFMTGLLLVSALCITQAHAQPAANTYSVKSFSGPAAPPFSPVVGNDRRITFRVKAPKASAVQLLFGEWNIKPRTMQRDSAGNWRITIGPVEPGIFAYLFAIDGIRTPDMANPIVKSGTELYSSIVEVPGSPPRFDEVQHNAHGVTEIVRYTSAPLHKLRNLYVYLPADYVSHPVKRFPVLYLRHGGGDDESSWTQESGRADIILDNLLAQQKAEPMIIVMSNGLTDGSWAGGSSKEGMQQLEEELLKDIIPLVEKRYRVSANREHRAIAGLSMGGGQAFIMGLRHPELFAWIGEFSSGLLSDAAFDLNERVPGVFSNAAALNKQIKLLWVGCGTDDPRIPGHTQLHNTLTKHNIKHEVYNIPGGHEWSVWRNQLHQLLPRLFKQTGTPE